MNIVELHNQGGPLFMTILSLLFLTVVGLSIRKGMRLFGGRTENNPLKGLNEIFQVGLFALVFGIFGQCVGLFQAFIAIEEAGDVSFALLAGGLKVSMITTLYGFVIFLVSFVIWFGLKAVANNRMNTDRD